MIDHTGYTLGLLAPSLCALGMTSLPLSLHAYLPACCQVNYKLRDWLFARQRYWGEPFPLLLVPQGEGEGEEVVAVSEGDLPITLPEMDDFTPTGTGEPPLAKAVDWVSVGGRGKG